MLSPLIHDDVIKWKHFPRYWPFVRGIHRSPVNSPHKGQWCGALMFSLICAWINHWVNNGDAGDLRRYRAHYDVIVMFMMCSKVLKCTTLKTTLITFYQHFMRYNASKGDKMLQKMLLKRCLSHLIGILVICKWYFRLSIKVLNEQ